MKFLSPPILALLASGLFGCALAPPSHSNGEGAGSSSSSKSSSPKGGSGGGGGGGSSSSSSSSQSASGGSAMGSTMNVGGSSSQGGSSSSSANAGASAGSGGTHTGGTGGSAMTGGSSSSGTSSRAGSSGGTTGSSGGAGGTSSRGGSSSGASSSGGASSSSGSYSSSNYPQPPKITGGSNGFTTRYWDCCKASCGWSNNAGGKPCKTCGKDGTSTVGNDTQSACNGGGGFMCYWGAPWAVSDTLAFGYAAHNGVACGTCFQLDFTGKGHYGSNAGAESLSNKTMIVQVINIGGIDQNQFDLLIPGGGVGANNACTSGPSQWGNVDIGAGSGGILTSCKDKDCVTQKCQAAFNGKPQLIAGCTWFTDWFNIADNPEMVFKQINCPSDITQRSGM